MVEYNSISLLWNPSKDAEGYQVEYRTAGQGTWQVAGSVTQSSYVAGELSPDTNYEFRVRAYNAQGFSAYSSVVGATTLAAEERPAPEPESPEQPESEAPEEQPEYPQTSGVISLGLSVALFLLSAVGVMSACRRKKVR